MILKPTLTLTWNKTLGTIKTTYSNEFRKCGAHCLLNFRKQIRKSATGFNKSIWREIGYTCTQNNWIYKANREIHF